MNESGPSRFTRALPVLSRIILWAALAVLLVAVLWEQPGPDFQWRLLTAGDRTNLYVIAAGSAEGGDASQAQLVYADMDVRRQWTEPMQGWGDALDAAAWQEDLAVLFTDGGLYVFGPSQLGYVPSPAGDAWSASVALTARDDHLVVVGVGPDGKPVVCDRGREAWGDLQKGDLGVTWTDKTGQRAAAAMRGGELHVVWVEQPVSETPIGEGPQVQWLHFAWRDARGKWHGPFEEKSIRPVGRPSVAPFGDKLAMVYLEQIKADEPPRVVYAEFTPGDHRWHRVRELAVPADSDSTAVTNVGLARFEEGHALAVVRKGSSPKVYRLSADTGELTPLPDPPRLKVAASGAEEESPHAPMWLLLGTVGLMLVLLVAARAAQRRVIRQRLASADSPEQEAARMVAAQMERLMYLPVLVRRIGAVVIDMLLVVPLAPLASMALLRAMGGHIDWPAWMGLPPDRTGPLDDRLVLMSLLLQVFLFVYYTIMEGVWQRSLGKMICRVRVVDMQGGRPALWRIVVRNLVRPIDLIPLMLGLVGLLVIVWTRHGQRLGDLAARTRVVMQPPEATPAGDDGPLSDDDQGDRAA